MPHISNTLRLLTLPQDVIGLIQEGNLTAGQARPLIGLPSATNIAEEIVAKNLSARSVEMLVRGKKGPQKRWWTRRMRSSSSVQISITSRVVPASSETIAASLFESKFNNDDLPALTSPVIETLNPSLIFSPILLWIIYFFYQTSLKGYL